MPFQIEMPHVGESVTEAVIEKWLKQPGDRIEKYEPIVEVVTDKVAMEVPAPATGELTRIVAQEGETVAMGAIIAEMNAEGVPEASGQPDEPVSFQPATPGPERSSVGPSVAPVAPSGLRVASAGHVGSMITGANVGPTGGAFSDTSLGSAEPVRVASAEPAQTSTRGTDAGFARLSPAVRRLIEQHDIDPSTLTGTGIGGRITRADVLAAVARTSPETESTSTTAGRLTRPSAVRRIIAEHMSRSVREIPHAWSAIEVDVSGLVACRTAVRANVLEQHGVNLTYLPFAIAVTAGALRSNPLLNSSWQENGILTHTDINVSIAVAGKDGLVVPVIRNADRKSVLEVTKELSVIVDRARDGKLGLDDINGGTFTLNNTGALGSVWGGAIINHPQAAILTTEAIVKRPVVVEGNSVAVRSMMNICLSFDHRVIDGAESSAFLQDVKRGLEGISADTALE